MDDDIVYAVDLSPSGLLIEIDVLQDGRHIGGVQIAQRAWPDVVRAVEAKLLGNAVNAQVNAIVTRDDDD